MGTITERQYANKESDEDFIQDRMDMCRHFTGVQNETCDCGVIYKQMWVEGSLPCFTGLRAIRSAGKCDSRDFPTRGEAVATLDAFNESVDRML